MASILLLFKCNRYSNWKQYLKCAASYLKHEKCHTDTCIHIHIRILLVYRNRKTIYANDSIYKISDIGFASRERGIFDSIFVRMIYSYFNLVRLNKKNHCQNASWFSEFGNNMQYIYMFYVMPSHDCCVLNRLPHIILWQNNNKNHIYIRFRYIWSCSHGIKI